MTENNKPIRNYYAAGVSCSVFENTINEDVKVLNFKFTRAYKNKEGETKYTDNFRKNDLLILAQIALEAWKEEQNSNVINNNSSKVEQINVQ